MSITTNTPRVLVLGGGPDAEREVSIRSSAAVHDALREAGVDARLEIIGAITEPELARMPADLAFPVLHGPFGEGGQIQAMLDRLGLPYVGCRALAAKLCMDKMATKLLAASLGIATAPAAILNRASDDPPFDLPFVVKPVHEGSSVGLHLCHAPADWARARADAAAHATRATMVERLIRGRELTVGVLDRGEGLRALPIIEITPAVEAYTYEAKYARTDTRYTLNPPIPPAVAQRISRDAERLTAAAGVRHLARVDFLLDASGEPWLLEVNTMPGFTRTSLLPMAAGGVGLTMPLLCRTLVERALARTPQHAGA